MAHGSIKSIGHFVKKAEERRNRITGVPQGDASEESHRLEELQENAKAPRRKKRSLLSLLDDCRKRRYRLVSLWRKCRKVRKKQQQRYAQEDILTGKFKEKKKDEVVVDEVALSADICREDFFEFVKEFWEIIIAEKPIWNWHIEFLCRELQVMAERVFAGKKKLYDLVVNIPPGTTKSTIISVMFPAWCWTRMISFRYIGASHSEKLALDLSLKSRDIVTSDKYKAYFPEIQLRDDMNTKSYFKNTGNGYRYAVGVNGSVIGMHAHMLCIDDPIDPLKARSAADLATSNYWIDSQLSNRKVDKAVSPMVLVMQRLHQDDPTALFLRRKKVRHICLPAEDAPNVRPSELRAKYVNGYLDPVRLDKDVLKEEKQKGAYYFSSQFRQDPVPEAGGMFKTRRLKVGIPPRHFVAICRFWDKAGTADGGAYTVGTLVGMDTEGRFWVLDVIRFRKDSFEREREICRAAMMDGTHVIVGVEQEPGSGGKESAENTARRLAGYKVRIIKVDKSTGGKLERADPWSVQMNAGNVYLPVHMWDGNSSKWMDWAEDWVEEHKFFPHGKYKDQVDSSAMAFSLVNRRRVRVGGMSSVSV
jgi:predicted phage terminase large subunit-like protein